MTSNRRAGVLTLAFGGLLFAAFVVALFPSSQEIRAGSVPCGSTYSAAFRSGLDYELDWLNAHIPRSVPLGNQSSRYGQLDSPPPRGLRAAGSRCVTNARSRLWFGEGAVVIAFVVAVVLARRGRSEPDTHPNLQNG